MNEADPLRAPKRERLVREDAARGDGAALGLVVALGLCVLGAIFYVHRHPVGEGADGAMLVGAGGEAAMGDAGAIGEPGGSMRQGGSFMGMRKEMKEAPLEQAKPIARDTFAPAVTHVTENDACKSLRLARDRIRDTLRRPHSEWEAADLQREMGSITSQGTERGCWTGGTG